MMINPKNTRTKHERRLHANSTMKSLWLWLVKFSELGLSTTWLPLSARLSNTELNSPILSCPKRVVTDLLNTQSTIDCKIDKIKWRLNSKQKYKPKRAIMLNA